MKTIILVTLMIPMLITFALTGCVVENDHAIEPSVDSFGNQRIKVLADQTVGDSSLSIKLIEVDGKKFVVAKSYQGLAITPFETPNKTDVSTSN